MFPVPIKAGAGNPEIEAAESVRVKRILTITRLPSFVYPPPTMVQLLGVKPVCVCDKDVKSLLNELNNNLKRRL